MSDAYQGSYEWAAEKYDSRKRYFFNGTTDASVGFTTNVKVASAELRDLSFMTQNMVKDFLLNNYDDKSCISTGFKIIQSTTSTTNNFEITAGTLFVQGLPPVILESNIQHENQDGTGNLTDADFTESTITPITTPGGSRTDIVVLDIYFAEVAISGSEYTDVDLNILGETGANRARLVRDITIIEGSTTTPTDGVDGNGIYHFYVKLATLTRLAADATITTAMIADNRTAINALKTTSSLSNDQILFGDSGGAIDQSSNLTFDGSTLTVANGIDLTGTFSLTGTLDISTSIRHAGDLDTIIALDTNQIDIDTGGKSNVLMTTTATTLNNDEDDIDFIVKTDTISNAIHLDAGADNLLINVPISVCGTQSDGKMHIQDGTAGTITATTDANTLILEGSTACGMSILAPNGVSSFVTFGSPADNSGGEIFWNYAAKVFGAGTNTSGGTIVLRTDTGTTAMSIDSSQKTTMAGALDVVGNVNLNSTALSAYTFNIATDMEANAFKLDGATGVLSADILIDSSAGIRSNGFTYTTDGGNTTGMNFPASSQVDIKANNVECIHCTETVLTINNGSINYDTAINWDTGTALFVEGSSGNVAIGITSGITAQLHIKNTVDQDILRLDATGSGVPTVRFMKDTATIGTINANTTNGVYILTEGANPIRLWPNGGSGAGGITVIQNGSVGIGDTSPSYQLELSTDSAGKPSTNTWTVVSDEKIKKNIKDYTKYGLKDLEKMRPVEFEYNGKAGFSNDGKKHVGYIAQEVEKIIPEMVYSTDKKMDKADKKTTTLKTVNTHLISFALIESVKELNNKINILFDENKTLKEEIKLLKK